MTSPCFAPTPSAAPRARGDLGVRCDPVPWGSEPRGRARTLLAHRWPLVRCAFQNFSASKALAEDDPGQSGKCWRGNVGILASYGVCHVGEKRAHAAVITLDLPGG
jgi:hypothetical protein